MEKRSLAPLIANTSYVLILGTLPGDLSLNIGQYYANPRNQFWAILERVFEERVGSNYENKVKFIMEKRLALWDVLSMAERLGSADESITKPVANDIGKLFEQFPELCAVAFNGTKAAEYYRRLVSPGLLPNTKEHLREFVLPSSSPTPGKWMLSLEQKAEKWRILRQWQKTE